MTSPAQAELQSALAPGSHFRKIEAQNAHELDVDRFRRFFACAENVIGKEGGR